MSSFSCAFYGRPVQNYFRHKVNLLSTCDVLQQHYLPLSPYKVTNHIKKQLYLQILRQRRLQNLLELRSSKSKLIRLQKPCLHYMDIVITRRATQVTSAYKSKAMMRVSYLTYVYTVMVINNGLVRCYTSHTAIQLQLMLEIGVCRSLLWMEYAYRL